MDLEDDDFLDEWDEPLESDEVQLPNHWEDKVRLNWLGDPWPYIAGDPAY